MLLLMMLLMLVMHYLLRVVGVVVGKDIAVEIVAVVAVAVSKKELALAPKKCFEGCLTRFFHLRLLRLMKVGCRRQQKIVEVRLPSYKGYLNSYWWVQLS